MRVWEPYLNGWAWEFIACFLLLSHAFCGSMARLTPDSVAAPTQRAVVDSWLLIDDGWSRSICLRLNVWFNLSLSTLDLYAFSWSLKAAINFTGWRYMPCWPPWHPECWYTILSWATIKKGTLKENTYLILFNENSPRWWEILKILTLKVDGCWGKLPFCGIDLKESYLDSSSFSFPSMDKVYGPDSNHFLDINLKTKSGSSPPSSLASGLSWPPKKPHMMGFI